MAAIALLDRIVDSGLVQMPGGIQLKRSIFVKNIPIDTTAPDCAVLFEAMLATGVPHYLDPHPKNATYGVKLVATSFDVRPSGGNNSCWLVVTYASRSIPIGGVFRNYTSGVLWETTDIDRVTKEPITVSYTVPDDASHAAGTAVTGTKKLNGGGTVQYPRPYKRILITRYFQGDFDRATWIDPYIGCANDGTWISEDIPDQQGLCISADATTEDGFNYKAVYDVMVKDDKWEAYAAYSLPSGQRPFDAWNAFLAGGDPSFNNGFSQVQVVEFVNDFNAIA